MQGSNHKPTSKPSGQPSSLPRSKPSGQPSSQPSDFKVGGVIMTTVLGHLVIAAGVAFL